MLESLGPPFTHPSLSPHRWEGEHDVRALGGSGERGIGRPAARPLSADG